jgi:hypothetical protein
VTTEDLIIRQGETFTKVIRWGVLPVVYKDITGITKAAPAVVTAVGHGLVDGWPVAITCVEGMTQINSDHEPPRPSDYRKSTLVDVDNIELNAVNASCFDAYVSSGILQYYTPVNLSAYIGRMSVRSSVNSDTELLSLTSGAGDIVIDDVAKTITIVISAAVTAAITWRKGVYDLELESGSGVVTRLLEGSVTVSREVTRV